ncbi:NADH:ubiquinone reductase (Na(+)-transporting) subunit F [Derxia gummosa]|uniref:NADH:ubiquinone reductase (Na(+)-transporting) subunit F n=1 Tax=Derxia gummosa DSM 723 TaxID=1121388 RepID=A0A8B6X3T8_9BURK|nr:phenol 2-monooxygenase domain-containing protein [Derxia gummosa]
MSYTLTIEPLGQTIDIAEGQTILDAALRAGIYLPHACCHGLCATCKVSVADGEVEHGAASSFALMDSEREDGKCLACCAMPQSDLVIEADIDEEPDALVLPVRDFDGQVSRIADLTPTIKGVWIALDDAEGMRFQAGQYVNLHIPGGETRAFSVASPPSARGEIELNIRRVPGGKGTGWVHDSLREGDAVRITGPYGRFFVRRSAAKPMLFIAGGSGLSSPRSMIRDLLEDGCSEHITLVYGARSRAELYYHEEFEALAKKHPNFSYLPALSDDGADPGWTGARGFVHDVAKAGFGNDFRGLKAYLCGPPVMIEACIATLMQGRLFERDIHTEKFLSAADAAALVRSPLFRSL